MGEASGSRACMPGKTASLGVPKLSAARNLEIDRMGRPVVEMEIEVDIWFMMIKRTECILTC